MNTNANHSTRSTANKAPAIAKVGREKVARRTLDALAAGRISILCPPR